ncbi:MAG: hypothetical protein C0403_10815 [Desulfobacterium sp.]|nr:hypothetical protein [Desulfobacterium sp.]
MEIIRNLVKKIKGISLLWKINLTGILIILIFTIIIYALILPYMAKEKMEERQGKLRAVVNAASSMIDFYDRAARKQGWSPDHSMPKTIEDAKREIIKNLREMRYDKTEFFFILDGNGNMIMHPTKPELEGKNMLDVQDPEGIKLFQEMVINSQRDGETFVRYIWQSKYSPVIFEPQMTYARYFWPWDWVICSSLYTQDIVDAMQIMKIRSALYDILAAIIAMTILFIVMHVSLSRPLTKLLSGIKEIHNGNLNYHIEVTSLDEIGYLSREFNLMVDGLKESQDRIVRSESKYRELTDMLPDIIYEADSNFRINYLNNAGYKLTGYTEEDIRHGLSLQYLVEKDDFSRLDEMLKKGEDNKVFITHKIIKKGGGFFYGENNTDTIFEGGQPVGLRGSIRDVTEKQKMEEQLLQAQKMETIGTLAGGLAHDFNNVLGGIVSTLSIIQYELRKNQKIEPEKLKKYLEIMENSGQRAVDMVQQLLTLSRRSETHFSPIDLNATIQNVKKICDNTFDKSIDIRIYIYEEPSLAYADPAQMEQVLLNLCVNANHAMTIMRNEGEPKGGRLSIGLDKIHADRNFCAARPEAKEIDYWQLSVDDTGIGMDPQTIAKIFVPFFTTKEKGRGTGLGLSMVYNIIHQHEGFINIYSEIGIGTTFDVYIPVLYGAKIADEEEKVRELSQGEGLILVVDDEEVMRQTAEWILGKCGYRVIFACDGAEGVQIFKERHREIKGVLLDLVMPRKSGEQAFLEMRKINSNVKVILASGFRQDERVNIALEQGINAFIQKPYTVEKLAEVVAEVFGGTCVDDQGMKS